MRAGATLLFDSEPASEERETELKASAMRDAVLKAATAPCASPALTRPLSGGNLAALGSANGGGVSTPWLEPETSDLATR